MNSMNSVFVSGYVSEKPTLRHTGSGKAVTSVRLGVPERRKDTSGEYVTIWNNVNWECWEKAAETAVQYLEKGTEVFIHQARLKTEAWEKDGEKRERLVITGGEFRMVSKKGDQDTKVVAAKIDDDEVPF